MNTMLPVGKSTRFVHAARLLGAVGALSVAASLVPTAAAFGISLDIDAGPPAPRHEVYSVRDRPGPDYVWVDGYWAGEPGHYTWVEGRWDRPPQRGARWVAPRWDHRDGRYVFVRGYWR